MTPVQRHISSQNFGILFCIERGPPALKDAGHYFGSTKSIFPEKDEEEATKRLNELHRTVLYRFDSLISDYFVVSIDSKSSVKILREAIVEGAFLLVFIIVADDDVTGLL